MLGLFETSSFVVGFVLSLASLIIFALASKTAPSSTTIKTLWYYLYFAGISNFPSKKYFLKVISNMAFLALILPSTFALLVLVKSFHSMSPWKLPSFSSGNVLFTG